MPTIQFCDYSKILVTSCLAMISCLSMAADDIIISDKSNTITPLAITEETPVSKQKCWHRTPSDAWVDRMRTATFKGVCKTVHWVDGLFGDEHEFDDKNFRGKVILGYTHDEIDGFDPKLRIRIKAKLPNVSDRLNAFIGRVEEDEFISNTETKEDNLTAVGLRSNDNDEAEWLVGLGYKDPKRTSGGFDYSVGAKISSGLNPYAKIRHTHLFKTASSHYFKTTQTLFWRKDDGYGFSTGLNYTYLKSQKDIIEWGANVKFTEDENQWEWITSTTWHHSFSEKRGISSRAYVRGEEENPVSIPEYGITFTYRKPFLRPWLFIEPAIDLRWEKETSGESYESAIRFGIQAEVLLGDYYKRGIK